MQLYSLDIKVGGRMKDPSVMFSSKKQDWATPPEFMDFLKEELEWIPDLDAACSPHNKKADIGYCLEEGNDGLKKPWFGHVWVNPPFGRELPLWIEKASEYAASQYNDIPLWSVMMLIPARTDTKWFHQLLLPTCKKIFFIKGRFNYLEHGDSKASNAPFPTMLVYFGNREFNTIYQTCAGKMDTLDVPSTSRGMKR